MVVTVAGQLMAFGHDPAHQARVPLGDPAEHEERALHAARAKEVEHAIGAVLDARISMFPMLAGDRVLEGSDLEIFLDVDRQRIAQHSSAGEIDVLKDRSHGGIHLFALVL